MKDQKNKYRVNEQGMIVEELDELEMDDSHEKEYPRYYDEHRFHETVPVST